MSDAGPDQLMSAPPGVDQDAGSANTIAATIEAAKAAGMAHVMEIEQSTHTAGEDIGDPMPVPAAPFHDTSVLGGEPGPLQGGMS